MSRIPTRVFSIAIALALLTNLGRAQDSQTPKLEEAASHHPENASDVPNVSPASSALPVGWQPSQTETLSRATDPQPQLAALRSKYDELMQRASDLAERCHSLPDDGTRTPGHAEALRQKLAEVVGQAFDTREEMQRAEVAQFLDRLVRLQQKIAARKQIREAIVARRVEELLRPELRWDDEQVTAVPSAGLTAEQPLQPPTPAAGSQDRADRPSVLKELTEGTGINGPMFLFFRANWCKPCQKLQPEIEELKRDGVTIIDVDIDSHSKAARAFQVNRIPTLVLCVDGIEVERVLGLDIAPLIEKYYAEREAKTRRSPLAPDLNGLSSRTRNNTASDHPGFTTTTKCTDTMSLTVRGPAEAQVGQQVQFEFELKNTAPKATNVEMLVKAPQSMKPVQATSGFMLEDSQISYKSDSLRPGQTMTRSVEFECTEPQCDAEVHCDVRSTVRFEFVTATFELATKGLITIVASATSAMPKTGTVLRDTADGQNGDRSAEESAATDLALDGFCPVTLAEAERWTKGDSAYSVVHDGTRYQFASEEALQTFKANPTPYVPVMGGHDVVVAKTESRLVPGVRKYGMWFREHILLFESAENLDEFSKRPMHFLEFAIPKNPVRPDSILETPSSN